MTKPLSTRAMRDSHTQRVKTSCLIERLQAHVLGELQARVEVVRKLIKLVRGAEGMADRDLEKAVTELILSAGLDMSQVRAAEVLLKKTLPDLANVEFRGEVTKTHTVLLPAGVTADDWAKSVAHLAPTTEAPAMRTIEHASG